MAGLVRHPHMLGYITTYLSALITFRLCIAPKKVFVFVSQNVDLLSSFFSKFEFPSLKRSAFCGVAAF